MTFWTLSRVSAALNGLLEGSRPSGEAPLRRIVTDTRALGAGDVFVALRGEHFDGHDFVGAAVAAGAAAIVVDDPSRASSAGVPVFSVSDTRSALGALAAFRRKAWPGILVSVAGSNGKTTTKELIASAITARGPVHATRGNLNNMIGVPLTVLALSDDAATAVVEMGTDHPGEINTLRQIVGADIAVVTSIGEEHLAGFGTMDAVLKEESAAFEGVELAVVPAAFPDLVAAARSRVAKVYTVGLSEGDLVPTAWGLSEDASGWCEIAGVRFTVPLPGKHNLENALLAIAVAQVLGVSLADAASGIATATVPGMRSAMQHYGDFLVLNDAYNANPASMRAALETLRAIESDRPKVAILGTMLELGDASAELHEEIAARALAMPLALIAAVGAFTDAFSRVLSRHTNHGGKSDRVVLADDVEALWPMIADRMPASALILLKGSRGMRMERCLTHLGPAAAGAGGAH